MQIDQSSRWRTGARQLTLEQREQLANDPRTCGPSRARSARPKGDVDAASWDAPGTAVPLQLRGRQSAVEHRQRLWVTPAERDALPHVLADCPDQSLPSDRH
ncbi:hypothetical protein [Pseudonocardia thermophila]|uniref:hypothetical protein n=1 Tax=Pseudonocardia thermophila TaxID=1848 RepID=UPI00248E54A0|nr:hypothetical protein [Pseudonocardia thermophila]